MTNTVAVILQQMNDHTDTCHDALDAGILTPAGLKRMDSVVMAFQAEPTADALVLAVVVEYKGLRKLVVGSTTEAVIDGWLRCEGDTLCAARCYYGDVKHLFRAQVERELRRNVHKQANGLLALRQPAT